MRLKMIKLAVEGILANMATTYGSIFLPTRTPPVFSSHGHLCGDDVVE